MNVTINFDFYMEDDDHSQENVEAWMIALLDSATDVLSIGNVKLIDFKE